MAANLIADASFVIALLSDHDTHHDWAVAMAAEHGAPWQTCDAAVSECFYMLAPTGREAIAAVLRRGLLVPRFSLESQIEPVLALLKRYADVPMSVADACIVRMTELVDDPMVLTTDSDFAIYRRHGRRVIPCRTPS